MNAEQVCELLLLEERAYSEGSFCLEQLDLLEESVPGEEVEVNEQPVS